MGTAASRPLPEAPRSDDAGPPADVVVLWDYENEPVPSDVNPVDPGDPAPQLVEDVTLTGGVGEAYTPTVIGPNGIAFGINNATLFAIGRNPIP